MVKSPELLANSPSFRTAKEYTASECLFNVFNNWPVVVFQILMLESLEPLTKAPSGKKASE